MRILERFTIAFTVVILNGVKNLSFYYETLRFSQGDILVHRLVNHSKRSFVRSLEVIGEATKNLPQGFRDKYPQVPWKDIAGLRDVLIHRYFGVNYKSVWDIIKNKILELKGQIEKILSEVESQS